MNKDPNNQIMLSHNKHNSVVVNDNVTAHPSRKSGAGHDNSPPTTDTHSRCSALPYSAQLHSTPTPHPTLHCQFPYSNSSSRLAFDVPHDSARHSTKARHCGGLLERESTHPPIHRSNRSTARLAIATNTSSSSRTSENQELE